MHGVNRIGVIEDAVLITFRKIPCQLPLFADIFGRFAKSGIILDMISQTSPAGENVSISFSCMEHDMVNVLELSKAISEKYPQVKPMVSSGNCKITLTGEEMRTQPGVFARALDALANTSVEVLQVTTAEDEISLLVTSVHLDEAVAALKACFVL